MRRHFLCTSLILTTLKGPPPLTDGKSELRGEVKGPGPCTARRGENQEGERIRTETWALILRLRAGARASSQVRFFINYFYLLIGI